MVVILLVQVLALFSNQILEVERLEALQHLEVLRLGNNKINSKKVEVIQLQFSSKALSSSHWQKP